MSAIKFQEKQKDIPRNVIRASRFERILTYVMVGDIIVLPIIWLLSLEMAYEWILYVYCGANIFFLWQMALIKIQEKQKDIPRNVIRASRSERILTYVIAGEIIVPAIIWLTSYEWIFRDVVYVYVCANIFFLLPMAFCFWILASFWKVFHIRARYFFYYILWIVPYGLILWGLAHPY